MGKFLCWIGLSILNGVLYRRGGTSKGTKWRDLGCPLVTYGYLLTLWHPVTLQGWGLLLLAFGLTFGALTTYFDSIFGYDNFYAHGFATGIACLPLFWVGIPLWLILARSLILALFMGLWSRFWGWDEMEEWGRGASIILTIPILLI